MSFEVQENRCLRLSDRVVVREVGEEIVVYTRDRGEVHQLNATAGYILGRCDGGTPLAAIIEGVTTQFDIDRTTAERDVRMVVQEMEVLGFVVQSNGTAVT